MWLLMPWYSYEARVSTLVILIVLCNKEHFYLLEKDHELKFCDFPQYDLPHLPQLTCVNLVKPIHLPWRLPHLGKISTNFIKHNHAKSYIYQVDYKKFYIYNFAYGCICIILLYIVKCMMEWVILLMIICGNGIVISCESSLIRVPRAMKHESIGRSHLLQLEPLLSHQAAGHELPHYGAFNTPSHLMITWITPSMRV